MLEEDGIQANGAKVGETFILELMKLRDDFEVVGDVRGKGLMLGLELVKSKGCVCMHACVCVCVCARACV